MPWDSASGLTYSSWVCIADTDSSLSKESTNGTELKGIYPLVDFKVARELCRPHRRIANTSSIAFGFEVKDDDCGCDCVDRA